MTPKPTLRECPSLWFNPHIGKLETDIQHRDCIATQLHERCLRVYVADDVDRRASGRGEVVGDGYVALDGNGQAIVHRGLGAPPKIHVWVKDATHAKPVGVERVSLVRSGGGDLDRRGAGTIINASEFEYTVMRDQDSTPVFVGQRVTVRVRDD